MLLGSTGSCVSWLRCCTPGTTGIYSQLVLEAAPSGSWASFLQENSEEDSQWMAAPGPRLFSRCTLVGATLSLSHCSFPQFT